MSVGNQAQAIDFSNKSLVLVIGENMDLGGDDAGARNGTGKTTFIRMLAGLLKSDESAKAEADGDTDLANELGVPQLNVSYKPQKIAPKFQGTVRQLLHKKIRDAYIHPQFMSDVMRPMMIDPIIDNAVQELSGGE